MKAITIRDLRSQPKQVQNTLAQEGEALLTSSGRPVAVLIAVDAENVDETLAMIRRARAQQALGVIRAAAKAAGVDTMPKAAIEEIVAKTRRRKPR